MSMKMSSYAISSRYLSNAYQQCNNYFRESVYEKNCLETGEMLNLSDFFVSLNYIPQYYKQALLQIVFDVIHLNNTNLFTVTNKHTIFQQNTIKRYEAMTLEVHRKLLSKMAARHAQAIARLQKSSNFSNVTIVLGNESCDLDSAVTSIVYAIFLHWQHNRIKCKVCTASKRSEDYKNDIFISLLDVKRDDFGLKTEVVYCLQEHGITDKDLVFSDDLNMEKLVAEGKTKVVLVDHHVLAKKYEYLAPHVTEIIDHRPLIKSQWVFSEDTRSTIEVVGSCCTLIAQRIRHLGALIAKDVDFFTDNTACAQLLHNVILLDTVNFSKEVDKATKLDVEIVSFLENLLKIDQCEAERKAKVDRLLEARSDVSGLSAAQLLRKDLKIFGHILVPSFPILVKDFLQKPNALEAVSEVLSSRKCTLALLLGMKLQGGLQRDGTVVSSVDDKLAEDLAKYLQRWSSPPLQLVPDPTVHCFYFKQMNLSASRKQYVPALNEFLNICKQ